MKTSEQLLAARYLITPPERWTQHAFARDAAGIETNSDHPGAVCWCSYGALHKTDTCFRVEGAKYFLWIALNEIDCGFDMPEYNDYRSHAEVLAIFDRAIKLAQRAGE